MPVAVHTPLDLPLGAWDSHVHVIDEATYPFAENHPYRPGPATLDSLLAFEAQLSSSISNVVLVAVSVYGTDNTSIIDSLRRLKGRGRGVVTIEPHTISDEELRLMHEVGVRAIRVNLRSTGIRPSLAELSLTLKSNADRVRPLGWSIQLYISLDQIPNIAPIIPSLGLPIIIDHLASPHPTIPICEQRGYSELFALLQSGQVWIKLSGTYRFPDLPGLDGYVRDILCAAPERVVFASDWPHTGGVENSPGGDRKALQPYRQVDDRAFPQKCKAWCGHNDALIRRIFVDNPARLWK